MALDQRLVRQEITAHADSISEHARYLSLEDLCQTAVLIEFAQTVERAVVQPRRSRLRLKSWVESVSELCLLDIPGADPRIRMCSTGLATTVLATPAKAPDAHSSPSPSWPPPGPLRVLKNRLAASIPLNWIDTHAPISVSHSVSSSAGQMSLTDTEQGRQGTLHYDQPVAQCHPPAAGRKTDLVEPPRPIGLEQASGAFERGSICSLWTRLDPDFDDIERLHPLVGHHPVVESRTPYLTN